MSEFYEGFYLANNPDVAKAVDAGAFGTGWEHYSLFGQAEGRSFAEPAGYGEFNEQFYLASNADVAKAVETGAFGTGWEHYSLFGQDEGRSFAEPAGYGEFNEQFYLANNADVALAVDAGTFGTGWEHYSLFGQDEGRSFAEPAGYGEFNELFYLASNADVAKAVESGAFATGWQHYQLFGEAEGRTFVQPEPVGEAILQETAFAAPDEPAPVEGETFTLTEAMAARAAGELPAEYTIEDNAANLVDATTAQEIITLDGAAAINVTGTATVAQMDTLLNVNEFSNVGSYTLADSVENLLAEGAAAIVAGAVEATVAGEPTLTVAEYNEIAAIATVATYTIEDSAANVLEAGADAAALVGADSILLTDAEVTLAQALELDALELGIDYTVAPFSLEDALAAEALPAIYTLTADVYAAGEVDVETATATLADVTAIVEGAQNDPAFEVADVFTWSVADTLANLEAADAAILEGATAYSLTDAEADLGELSGAQYALVDGATNTEDYTFTVVPADVLDIAADASTVVEGNEISFTVELSHAVNVDRDLNYSLAGQETTAAAAADPLTDLGQINGSVTVAAGETTATITLTPAIDVTEGLEAFVVNVLDDQFAVAVTSAPITIQDSPNSGQLFTLTTGIDEFTGGAGNDTFTANDTTLTALDSLDGGAGTDLLRIDDTTGASIDFSVATIENIETINLRSVGDVSTTTDSTTSPPTTTALDATAITGLNTFNVTRAQDVYLEAAATTDVNVSGATGGDGGTAGTGLIQVDGGKNVGVTDGAYDNDITIGGTTTPAGTVTVTDSDQGSGAIEINGGTDVTVNNTNGTGTTTIAEATGAVVVNTTLTSDGDALAGGNISVTGGSTIDVTVNGTITADAAADDGHTLTAGGIVVKGDGSTTDVTVIQNLVANDYYKAPIDDVPATQVLTFKALAKDETVVVDGLTFTASKALTAEQVAAAFANLGADSGAGNIPTAGDIVSAGGPVTNGVYTGTFSNGTWTSGAADGANVTFTAAATTDAFAVGGVVAPDSDHDAGTDNSDTAESGDVSVTYGAVTINEDGVADASIENITVDGYAASTIGDSAGVDALKTLSLANSDGTMGVATAAATLDLTVDDVNDAVTLTAASLLDLTLNAVGDDSAFALASAATTDLTIDATADLDLTGSVFTSLVNATIGGAGAVILAGQAAATLETIDASGNTGGVAASINGDATAVTGGDGDDEITVLNAGTAIDQEISLGAGDDAIDLSNGGTVTAVAPTATIDGGADTDLLAMDSAAAAGADAAFAAKFTNFEQLEIAEQVDISAGSVTVDLSVLEYDYVVTNGTESGAVTTFDGSFANALIFDNAANGSTFELNEAQVATGATGTDIGSIQIVLDDATGNADSLNLITDAVAGMVEAQGVETINVTGSGSVMLKSADLTTVTVNGNSSVVLDATSTSVELVDASMSENDFIFDSLDDTTATVINGGQGDDEISISGQNDEVYAGAGDDRITIANTADASVVEGGEGNDLFDITGATLGKEAYATISDFEAGDQIAVNASSFKSQGVVVTDPSEMTLTDWFTAAFNQTVATEAIWFQHNDNTYIVDNTTTDDFVAGDDVIVKLTGLVDLDTAAFNDAGIIEMA